MVGLQRAAVISARYRRVSFLFTAGPRGRVLISSASHARVHPERRRLVRAPHLHAAVVGPWGLGLLRGAPAVGALLMSMALTRRPVRRRADAALLGAVAVYGAAQLVFGLSTVFALSMVALAIGGGADIRQTLVQLETPNDMRGPVSAINSVFVGASNQLGEFESGATAALMGPVGSVVLGGVGTLLVAGLWLRLFPTLAQRDELVQGGAAAIRS